MKKIFPRKRKYQLKNQIKLRCAHFTHLKKPAILKILPSFTGKFKPDTIEYEKKLLTKLYSEELAIYPLKTSLSNITKLMKRLQSHKKRH